MNVIAKFKCTDVKQTSNDSYAITLHPVYSEDPNSENAKFYSATPGGFISLQVVNTEAAKAFEVEKEYYVEFTPALTV